MTSLLIALVAVASTIAPLPSRIAAAAPCRPAAGAASPVGATPCPGVRPGAYILVPTTNTTCTLGFLLRDRRGRSYMTTAGHCAVPEGTRRVWPRATGPRVYGSDGRKIGTVSFALIKGTKDFALILLDKAVRPKGQVCHFGGPTGLNAERRTEPTVVQYYGQAEVVSQALPARSGVVLHTRDPDLLYAQAPIYLGDSGGPWLTDDGRALGYLTHIVGYGPIPSADVSTALVRRLGPAVAAAEEALKTDLTLVTAPTL